MPRKQTNLRRIAAYVRRGGLIAYPTESCYGLGCDPKNRNAVQRLLKLKQRPQKKGLILVAGKYAQLVPFVLPLDRAAQDTLKNVGAACITYLLPAKKSCPRWLTGAHEALAVRITAHRLAAALCNGLNMALVSTSANKSGEKPARTYAQASRLFGKRVLVLAGETGGRKNPSTIRAWADGKIVRK